MSAYRYSNNYLLIELHIYSNGNLLEELTNNVVTTTNTYNERNELISTTKDNETFEYEYNAEGKRISKSDGTDIVKFIYEGKNIILEVDESDDEIASNIYGLALVKRETEDEEGYYLYNGHGDVVTIVDENSNVLDEYSYDSWGNVIKDVRIGIGKNLFDKNNNNQMVSLFTHSGSATLVANSGVKSVVIPCLPNTQYTVSKTSSERFTVSTIAQQPADGITRTLLAENNNATELTVTTPSNAKYLFVYIYTSTADTLSLQDIIDTLQIEEGSTATPYESYTETVSGAFETDNPFLYSGYYYDVETENYYLMSRYYNPSIARFITEDTYRGILDDPLSLNRYVYVHNNPLIYYDPDGYFLHTIIIGGTSGIIGGVGKIASNVSNGEEWFEGVAGATIEGTIIGTSFSMCGPKCAIPGTYVGNVANQAWEDVINGNEIKIDQIEAITHTVVTTAAVVVGGIGGPVTTSGTARMIDVATKSFLAGTAADTTYQFMDSGITTNDNGRITGYDINKAIMNYDSVRAYKTGITAMVVGPIVDKGYTSLMDNYDPKSTWGRKETLEEHYESKGKQFNVKNQNDYVKKANQFYKNRNQYDNFVGTDGNTRVYDVNTNTLGSYNPDGTTRTFMKPRSKHYWNNQIEKWKVK